MPKKKPIAKRLEKLFEDVKPEQTPAELKPAVHKRAPVEKTSAPFEAQPPVKAFQPAEILVSHAPQTDSVMSLAFQAGQNNWATLQVLDETEQRKWSPDEQLLVKQVADQLSLALENARLFQEAQRRAREMTALAEVGREISATLDLETVLERISSYAFDLLQAASAAAYLPAEKGETWHAVAAVGLEAKEIRNDIVNRGEGILGKMILQKNGAIMNNVDQMPGAMTIAGTARVNGFEHLMSAPVLSGDRLTGLLAVWRNGEGRQFTQTELDFLTSLSRQTAIAIENARLFGEVTASQGQLSEALRIARIGYFEIDLQSRTITFTDELFSLLNTSAQKEGGYQLPFEQTLQRFVVAEDILAATGAIRDAIDPQRTAGDDVTSEVRYKTADGRVIWVSSTYKVERAANGQALKVAGSSQDITDRKTNELTQAAITQISDAALTSSTIDELVKTVHEAVGALMPARNFYIALYDANTDLITFPYYVDEHDQPMPSQNLGMGLTSYVIRTGKALLVTPEIYTELEESGEVLESQRRGVDWLGVPLRSEGAIRGVMAVQSYDSSVRITDRHREILSILGAQTTAALERLQAREALSKSEADLRALFSSMQDVVIVYDRDGRYVRLAPTNPALLFRPPQDMVGKLIHEVLPKDLHEPFMTAIHKVLAGEENINIEYPLTLGGQEFWFLANISKLNNNEVFWVARDITGRKKAEEAISRRNEYLAASAEISRLVTSSLDLNTIFTRTVNLVSERFGFYFSSIYSIEETGFNAILREATGEAGETMKAQRHSVVVGFSSVVGKVAESGTLIFMNDVSNEPLFHPNPLLPDTRSEVAIPLRIGSRILGVIDIQSTQTNAFTEDDISVLQSLSDQVAVAIDNARSYELSQQLIRDLREVDQLKSQFLANMSHELRTPLNSIIGFSRVILKGIDGPVSDMQQQDLTAIYSSGQHLLGLINDILDLARIEAGKMELNFEEVQLSEMVNSVMSTAKGLVKEKPIRLISKVPADMPTVRGDTMRVRQVLINLLSNASKFTDEGTITVETLIQKGLNGKPEALINVIDTGPGISPEGREKLFKAFSQVDGSATRKSGGSGLGLSICANLIQLQGGRIGVDSEEGRGSTFWFTLPLYHQPQEEIPKGKKVILAIDDDPQVISLYERYLNPQGYHVVPLTDPSKARQRILEVKPYAVTLDIMMPNTDGWDVLTRLKSDPDTKDYPVVICSIVDQTNKGFSLGAAEYLVKPILEEDLLHALDRLNKNGDIIEVLVIDDDPNDLRLIGSILHENGKYKPILAEGGRKGWEAINQKAPHAVILDIFMPDMDGFSVLEKLRDSPTLREIPVLVVSGGGLTNEQKKQLSDFGQRLITKELFKEGELISNIENALKRIGL